ncbi:MAG: RHS repeat-associated core domain-containing protein [Deltaproteobacteria bacterium]|nr:RHS repeat-associated core domain-containing protein [Deltaproteobacteria bacterium]
MAALTASLRTRFVSDSLHALLSRLKPSRFRNLMHRVVCFFTGHPVDVASGKVMTEFVDIELPGPMPLKIERIYSSAFASRGGPLGHGWSFSLNQAIWRERGKVVLLAEDGREIEFDTFEFPDHQIRAGQSVYNPIERLTLCCDPGEVWRVIDHEGVIRQFGPVAGRPAGMAMLYRIRSRCGFHEISYFYDDAGRLAWVRDSGGRMIGVVHDGQGRVSELHLPKPQGEGFYCHRRYVYDGEGDLVEVVDSLGKSWRFAYVTHLLTQETDRNGLSFYFAYDGLGEDAWCVRTWGDGGIYDHVLSYDKRKHVTWVTNSLGYTTQYHMNLVGQVVKVVDPLGGETKYEYDPVTLNRLKEIDALGNAVKYSYDRRGNIVRIENPDGASMSFIYHDKQNLCLQVIDVRGGVWMRDYDGFGQCVAQRNPLGHFTRFHWRAGKVDKIEYGDSGVVRFDYDNAQNLVRVIGPTGADLYIERDGLGRSQRTWTQGCMSEERNYDAESNVTSVRNAIGIERRFTHDAENNIICASDGARMVTMRYGGYYRLVERREGCRVERFSFNSEDNLIAMVNTAGERSWIDLDERGLPIMERTFDGRAIQYERDPIGRVTGVRSPSGNTMAMVYDSSGRVISEIYSDGNVHAYAYDPDDMLREARNENGVVIFERDALGRLVCESFRPNDEDAVWVRSEYQTDGARVSLESSFGAKQWIERDFAGHPVEVTVDAGIRWNARFERDPRGWETARTQDGSVAQYWKRDATGRPVERYIYVAHQLTRQETYSWSGDDRVAEIFDSEHGRYSMMHDNSGRLLGWRSEQSADFRFIDENGRVFRNLNSEDRDYGPGGRLDRDRQLVVVHDADGQRIEQAKPEGKLRLSYDARGWLRKVERDEKVTVIFEYDALGRRICKRACGPDDATIHAVRWIWDGEFPIHEIQDGQEPITWVYEPERWSAIAKIQGNESRSILTNLAGAPAELYDTKTRHRCWQMRLDMFGSATVVGNPHECLLRWPGQYADVETGLYYNRYRYYDPETGLYVTPDPLGLAAGSRIWSYVDDPILWIDPLGLCDFLALFRGTTAGYPGNPGVQLARRTPTSTNPAIATIFATQASQHGNGVLHILSPSDLTGIRTGPGNVLAHLEAEVVVHALPRQVRNRATTTITADAARRVLADMGIHVPAAISDIAALDRAVRNAPYMSNNQIRKFLRRASEHNTNPKCGR